MGGTLSKAANDIGSVIGNAFAAPFKSIFSRSCNDVCSGTWDVVCFIEHFCIRDLVKLLLVCGLCYIVLIFLYLLFKLGICQCCIKSLCKIWWAACETYWFVLEQACCLCWHKLTNTKRVYRGRHGRKRRQRLRDVELGYSAWSDEGVADRTSNDGRSSLVRKRDDFTERRIVGRRRRRSMKHVSWRSFHSLRRQSTRAGDRIGSLSRGSYDFTRKHRRKVSVRLGGSCRSRGRGNLKQLRIKSLTNRRRRRKAITHKRRRI